MKRTGDLVLKPWAMPAALAIMALAIYLPLLGSTGLWDPYESMAAEVSREAAHEGAFMPLRFDGEPVHGLPPFFFWVQAIVMLFAGTSEWAVRLPAALVGAGLVALVAHLASRIIGRGAGALAGAAVATSAVVVVGVRHASPEIVGTLVVTCAALAGIGVISPGVPPARRQVLVAHVLAAASVLAAGFMPLLILVATLGSGAIVGTIPASRLGRLAGGRACILPWAVVAAWLVAGTVTGHTEFWATVLSISPFAHATLLGFAPPPQTTFTWQIVQAGHMAYPWLIAVPAAFLWLVPRASDSEKGSDREISRIASLHVLAGTPVLVLTVAGLSPPYLPLDSACAAPFLSIICAWGLSRAARMSKDEGFVTLLPLGGVLVMLGAGSQGVDFFWHPKRAIELGGYMLDRVYPELGPVAKGFHTGLAILVGASAAPMTFFRRFLPLVAAALLVGGLVLGGYHVFHVFQVVEPYMSVGPLYRAYEQNRTRRDRLVALELDPQVRSGHVFYFERRMQDVGGLQELGGIMAQAAGKNRLVMVTSHVRDLYNEVHAQSCGQRIEPMNEERRWYSISAYEGPPPLPSYRIVVPGGRAGARIAVAMEVPLFLGDGRMLTLLGWSASVVTGHGMQSPVTSAQAVVPRGGWLDLSLYVRAEKPIGKSFKVLLDAIGLGAGAVGATVKGHHPPACGRYPTYLWKPGEVIRDRFLLYVPFSQPDGSYRLRTGFYRQEERMTVQQGTGSLSTVTLGTIVVK